MAFLGLFGKKKAAQQEKAPSTQERMIPAMPSTPRPTAMESFSHPSDLELPDIPPLEDLDLPPPPVYPTARPTPKPQIPELPTSLDTSQISSGDMFVSNRPFAVTEPKIDIPLEDITGRKLEQFEMPKEKPREEPPTREFREDIARRIERRREARGPLYVKVDDYRTILEGTTQIKDNLKDATDIVVRMNELKNEEDKEFEKWRAQLEDIQRKLSYVDKIIFESS